MKIEDLKWRFPVDFKELEESDILETEKILKIKFPTDFRNSISRFHGGFPKINAFYFKDEIGEMGSGLAMLLSFNSNKKENILDVHNNLKHQLPKGIIPIADDGGGDFICFDFRSSETSPKVVYWHHEKKKEKSITYLCETFTDFIDMLKED